MFKLRKKAGKADDFPAFYHAHERLIRGTLFHLVQKDDLDDLVQQTFIRCWENRDQFEGRSKPGTWIVRIAMNLAHDHWRKNKAPLLGSVEHQEVAANVRFENRQAIECALSYLSFEHRSMIVLMYFNELTLEEISEATGDKVGTVKSRLHYARSELRRVLIKLGIKT